MTAGAFKEIRKRPGVMLAYCTLRRTLRNTVQFRGNVAGVLVVIVDKGWIGRFQRAAELLLSGQRHAFFNAETSRHQVVTIESGSKKTTDLDVLRAMAQTVVVTDDFEALSPKIRMAAEEILYVDKPTVRHVMAVRELTGRNRIAAETARKLVNADWDVIDALLCRQSLDYVSFGTDLVPKDSLLVTGPRLSELPGLAAVRDWASKLATDLMWWREGRLHWSLVDSAALLVGPPGVGKTLCASALAAELGIAFIPTSAGQWQSAGEGHLGDMLRAMRASFEKAKSKPSALLFVDELDSIGNREHRSRYAYYETQVVNTFLELTSKAFEWPGVVLLAATNRPDDIEPAIVRSGRFENHIYIDVPSPDERAEILSYHLGGFPADLIKPLTDQLHRPTPSDLECMSRAIKRLARSAGRPLELVDLENSMPRRLELPDEALERAAIHECGHAICALTSGFVDEVIVTLSKTILEERVSQTGGQVEFEMRDSTQTTEAFLRARIRIGLAGMVAEQIATGNRSIGGSGNRGSDLDAATGIATRMVAAYGFGRVPRLYADVRRIDTYRPSNDAAADIDRILLEEWDNAKVLLTKEWNRLLALVPRLIAEGNISLAASEFQFGAAP
ncbi:AAA family ATPase [Rhizobium leguminosarum]|uniref:AAA family ATPase n=1 Tax=Rhizobium leguminosarum TaxID=384 RepID=UPI0021BC1169|nr:AAA family ATPase [Rhizobium leguminosarum]